MAHSFAECDWGFLISHFILKHAAHTQTIETFPASKAPQCCVKRVSQTFCSSTSSSLKFSFMSAVVFSVPELQIPTDVFIFDLYFYNGDDGANSFSYIVSVISHGAWLALWVCDEVLRALGISAGICCNCPDSCKSDLLCSFPLPQHVVEVWFVSSLWHGRAESLHQGPDGGEGSFRWIHGLINPPWQRGKTGLQQLWWFP